MARKKIKDEEKHFSLGISLDPEIIRLLKIQAEKENISISKLIDNVMKEHLKKEKRKDTQ